MINGCSDERYFFIRARDGADPCDQYDSCEECPYHEKEESEDES